MATTGEFLRDYGVDIRGNGQRHWPDEIEARIVDERFFCTNPARIHVVNPVW